MGLSKVAIRNEARILLNELVPSFWKNTDLDTWVDSAAIDISTKTYGYEKILPLSLITNAALYLVETDYLKIVAAIYNNEGLTRITPQMQGIQYAVSAGPPKHFYEFASRIGFYPVPTSNENAKVVTVFYAQVTNSISNLSLKFHVPAVLFTVSLGLAKERQYAKAAQMYGLYLSMLGLDRKEVQVEKTEVPQPTSSYILKLIGPQQ